MRSPAADRSGRDSFGVPPVRGRMGFSIIETDRLLICPYHLACAFPKAADREIKEGLFTAKGAKDAKNSIQNLTADFTDDTDGKMRISYPCHPRYPRFKNCLPLRSLRTSR